jgi:hypothetical protein
VVRFRIHFVAEATIVAVDMRDALRQAEGMGATEITSVTRVR